MAVQVGSKRWALSILPVQPWCTRSGDGWRWRGLWYLVRVWDVLLPMAACAGAVSTMLIATLRRKPILLTGTVNGSLGGLVGITAGCATMSPIFAIVTGAIAGAVVTYGPMLLEKFRLDDVVDAVSVHGFCGAWGTLAAGLFFAGDLFDVARIQVQLLGIGVGIAWGFGLSLVMYLVIDRVMGGMRADTQHEQRGLDYTEHAELGYPEFQQQALFDSDQLAARR